MPLPLYLAPMAELSHRALRELIEGFGGCDVYFSEMLSAGAVLAGGPYEPYYLDGGPCPQRLVYQLCGAETRTLADAAALLDQTDALGIDINMGCSAPAIMRGGSGAAWLGDSSRAALMIREVRKRTAKRLSVKLRIGESDDFDRLLQFAKSLEDEGVELITLHPRTTKEKFKRHARWDYVERLSDSLRIDVAGNGDIDSLERCQSRASSRCAALMIGRLAARQPWVFAAAKAENPIGPVDLEETALRFLSLLEQFQPPEFWISRARRFFRYFCENCTWGTYLFNQLNRAKDLSECHATLRTYFAENPQEKISISPFL